MRFENQTVVVIGGSAGMGKAIAQAVSEEGGTVIIGGRSQEKMDQALAGMGSLARGIVVDNTDSASIQHFFQQAGPIDHLVLPGSSVKGGAFHQMSWDEAQFSMNSKFWGQYLAVQAAIFKPRGSVVLFSGVLSDRPSSGHALLAAINAGVEGLGRALAIELAPIRVNTISPGLVAETDAYKGMSEAARASMYEGAAKHLPVGHVGSPDEIAQAALMLMHNTYITGVTLRVDGGAVIA
ncbi:MAG: SDR family oxidoreductase [Cyanobacteria bacterium]|nr:SDR family oxidoreductase [Cyanobacteriota bacterium]